MEQRVVNGIIENFLNSCNCAEYINIINFGKGYGDGNKATLNVNVSGNIDDLISTMPSIVKYNGKNYRVNITNDKISKNLSCIEDNPEFYNWQTVPPSNRGVIRPLKGGISVTNYSKMSNSVGTLGFLAIDNDTNSIVGVSNCHVVVNDAFYASERIAISPDDVIEHAWGDVVTQPHEPQSLTSGFSYRIGEVKKYQPLVSYYSSNSNWFNKIDTALVSLDEESIFDDTIIIDLDESYNQLGFESFNSGNGLDFATTGEIDSLFTIDNEGTVVSNYNLFISSRTTGVKGNGDMKLKAVSQGQITSGPYNKQNTGEYLTFSEVIFFVATLDDINDTCPYPINGGDSGSAVIADFNGTYKIVGQATWGVTDGGETILQGVFSRIDNIVEALNISPFNSSTASSANFSNTNGTLVHYEEGLSNQKFITIDGKKYWQVGIDYI
jgi:hypothetical protein